LAAFKDFVLSSVGAITTTYREVAIDATETFISSQPITRISVSGLHEQLFKIIGSCSACVREVVLSLVRCSSPQYPEKLLAMLAAPIADMVAALEAEASGGSGGRTGSLFAAAVDVVSLNTVLSTLLACCSLSSSPGTTTTTTATATDVDTAFIDLTAHALFSSLVLLQRNGSSGFPTSLDTFSTSSAVPIPLSATSLVFNDSLGCLPLMAVSVPLPLSAPSADSGAADLPLSFEIFNSLVCKMEAKWTSLTSNDTKLMFFRTINEFYRRREFDTCMSTSRKVIEKFLENLKNSESNSDILDAAKELYRFVAA
jgi:hypothetical protein